MAEPASNGKTTMAAAMAATDRQLGSKDLMLLSEKEVIEQIQACQVEWYKGATILP